VAYDEVAVVHTSLGARGPGVLVDVGAHHGESLRRFAEDGWTVYAFEPEERNRKALTAAVSIWPQVTVDARAVAERDGEAVDLYTSEISTGIATLTPFHASHRPTSRVTTVRLDTFLANIDEVTIVKTDAEGYDLPVLRTFPWGRLRPRAVICEFEDRKTVPLGYTFNDLANFLTGLGYVVLVSEWFPVVEYGQRHRWRSIRRYPVRLSDPRSWGNLIAVDRADATNLERTARRTGLRLRLRRGLESLRSATTAPKRDPSS
jgi:FkbM family methyltransferase